MRVGFLFTFLFRIALPMCLASLGVATLTFDLLDRLSTGANIEDHKRSEEIITSALSAAQSQLAAIAADNSHWDDAVLKLYGTADQGWLQETYSVPTQEGGNYDVLLVVDRDITNAVAGIRRGQRFRPATDRYTSGRLAPLLDRLSNDVSGLGAATEMINTADGLAVVAVTPILPLSKDFKFPPAKPRYFVFAKLVTPEYLQAIGRQYVIADLNIAAGGNAGSNGAVVKDSSGAPIATLEWTDRRPGDVARRTVERRAVIVLAFLVLVMLGIAVMSWRLIRNIARREAVARHDAFHDALTGLPNRAAMYSEIEKARGATIAVAFADLDGFKDINDTYDHETGDSLIRRIAASLPGLVGDRGLACRLGGDEFVGVFFGNDATERAFGFSDALIASLRAPFDLDGKIASVGVSIGIAVTDVIASDPQELMRRADIAMYEAKTAGRNRHRLFVPDFDADRKEDGDIAVELRRIIADGSIEVAYQAIVDGATAAIVSVEALARWPSSSSRHVAPDRFVRVAETHGLIDDLGNAILAKACATARHWPGVRLSANISPLQLRNPALVSRTLRTITQNGMDCRNVELEITESRLVDDVGNAKRVFDELRAAGIQIALDDFGSGFSSIGYLRQLGFDRIKIDRSLVERVIHDSAQQKTLQGAILMAAGVNAMVTVEGVEREEQINLLRLIGCAEMQGNYFSRPLRADEFSRLLAGPPTALDASAA